MAHDGKVGKVDLYDKKTWDEIITPAILKMQEFIEGLGPFITEIVPDCDITQFKK